MSHADRSIIEFEPVEGKELPEVTLRVGPGGVFIEGDEFSARRKVARGEWVTIGDVRIRVRRASDRDEEGEVNSVNWTRPELLVSTLDNGHVRRLRSILPMEEGSDILIGRSGKKNDIILNDEHVSRRHVRIVVRGGRHLIEDLGSRWGTYVNDERVESPTLLAHGDEIRVGKSVMRFVKFSDGFDFATTDDDSGGPGATEQRPSWVAASPMHDSMTITATTLLASPEQGLPTPRPASPAPRAEEDVSVSARLTGWMRKKK
ncbi:MAG: FHA domain-containing protein [Leptolyngbya sp. PLA3]|nr:MAG: FHA domain-containing protein [Cyanobacteria bacterium CYA]MCE7969220.1 FHA domain-containing protein [Leptolyngbya sp. PL-A3]